METTTIMTNRGIDCNTLVEFNHGRVELEDCRRDAKRFPRLQSYPFEELYKKARNLVFAAALYRGQELEDEKVDFIALALCREILADRKWGLPHLTFEEMGYAIRAAVLEEGRQMMGISVASLYGALVDYAKGDGHAASERARLNKNI